MKVLIVDDSKTSLMITQAALEKMGHAVVAINDPFETQAAFVQSSPDLVILDVMMEGMSGFDCAKQIRSTQHRNNDWVPIIFLSGLIDDEHLLAGIESGGDDYLTKPFSDTKLKAKIMAMERITKMRHELVKIKEQLAKLSTRDKLTGASNRLAFESEGAEIVDKCIAKSLFFSVLMLDLDHFKEVNDTLGHESGDQLLVEAVKRISNCVRETDFVSRLGGDEFAIILVNCNDPRDVGNIAGKIIEKLSQPFSLNDAQVKVGASIGIATYPNGGNDLPSLCKNADIALYRAKDMGRNNYQYFTASLQQEHEQRVAYVTQLENAITQNELRAFYQPIFDMKTNKPADIEALVRWQHPKKGLLLPSQFLDQARQSGAIVPIGNWMIEQVCKDYREIHALLSSCKLSINISEEQLGNPQLSQAIDVALMVNKVSKPNIVLELTGDDINLQVDQATKLFKELEPQNISFTLDDFGHAFLAMPLLEKLPVHMFKIDHSLIQRIEKDDGVKSILTAIISFARELKIATCAKGVETQQQHDFLKEAGCDYAQGDFMCESTSLEELLAYLKEHKK